MTETRRASGVTTSSRVDAPLNFADDHERPGPQTATCLAIVLVHPQPSTGNMEVDQDVLMDEHKTVQWPNGKGKGKAVDQPEGHDPENLPWYVLTHRMTFRTASEQGLYCVG